MWESPALAVYNDRWNSFLHEARAVFLTYASRSTVHFVHRHSVGYVERIGKRFHVVSMVIGTVYMSLILTFLISGVSKGASNPNIIHAYSKSIIYQSL